MRKGIKILRKVCVTAVLLFVIFPLFLSLVLHIPFVQNFAVHQFSKLASSYLETRVEVSRVDVNMWGKACVRGFYVEDYQHDTLLYVDRADAFVLGFGGGLRFHRGDVDGVKLFLRETPDSVMNIKQIIDRLSNPKKKNKKPFTLKISKAAINNMELRIERLQHRNPDYGVDFGNMRIRNMKAFVDDLSIAGPEITADILSFSADELSGFRLEHLSGRFALSGGKIRFEDALLATSRSYLSMPELSLEAGAWAEYKNFIHNVRIEGRLRNSTLTTDDVAYFAPRLRDWHITLSEADLNFGGQVDNFAVRLSNIRLNGDTYLRADAMIKGLPDIKRTYFDISLPRLSTTASGADSLAASIVRRVIPEKIKSSLDESGTLELSGRFKGTLSAFTARAEVATPLGSVGGEMNLKPTSQTRYKAVQGGVQVHDMKLGELLGMGGRLGNATLSATVDGVIGRNHTDANIVGNISSLQFNGYDYDSLRFDGHLFNKQFEGLVTARDRNLNFDFEGLINHNGEVPCYDFTLDLHHADLSRLHINRRDSVSQLSGLIRAKGCGRTLDDMNGEVSLRDGLYRYNDQEVECKKLVLKGKNDDHHKNIDLKSDFLDARFRSRLSYMDVFHYLKQSFEKYFPMLDRSGGLKRLMKPMPLADSYSELTVRIHNFNPIADAISPGLQVADGSSLRLQFNPATDKLLFRAASEYIERNHFLATRLNVNSSNRGDSLSIYASAEDLYAGAVHLPHFSATGGARNGTVQLSTGFNDTDRRFSGRVGFRAGMTDEAGPYGPMVDIRILPSSITLGDRTWQVFARRILLDTARVSINKFYVMNSRQDLLLDGVASRNPQDSIVLRLRNFDLEPFSQITDRMGYAISGRTSGEAVMKAMLGRGEISADIHVDSLAVNGLQAPPLRLTSNWDIRRNRAGVYVTNRQRGDTLVRGFYVPDRVRYYARLSVDSLNMGLLDPLLSGVISSTSGTSSADLVLQGQRRNADLSGYILAKDLQTSVDFTQVTYKMPAARIDVRGSRFSATRVPVYDEEGNRGLMDFGLDLSHLSNIAYDIKVSPEKMLVLNTDEQDNDFFYGKVHATGDARIRGKKGRVNMDISAVTDDNSSFFMPLSSKSNISNASFVTFKKPELIDTVDLVLQKKKAFERRRKKVAGAASQMNINLSLDVRPNVDLELSVSGNTLKAKGEGTLNMQINPSMNLFEMYGDYIISQGSFLFSLQRILNRKFVVTPGSTIRWTGSPLNAALDIEAVYKLKASLQPLLGTGEDRQSADRGVPVECVILLNDWLTNPSVNFDVRVPGADPETQALVSTAMNSPETVDMQFLYLLLFKSFMSENNSSSQNIGASVSYNTGLELLSRQLSNLLSTNGYDIFIDYRPKSEMTGDEVDFGVSKSLINDRLFVEVEGNYVIDNKQAVKSNSMSNFMGEAYITYLIDRAGALKLKAFTQTIDRFDENQGLQETGIGIYFKEDFNNFRDFRHRIRERFTNKKRKARREERRRAREAARRGEGVVLLSDEVLETLPADSAARGVRFGRIPSDDKTPALVTADGKR